MSLEYFHVDVFSHTPYSGNSLPVFPDASGLNAQFAVLLDEAALEVRHWNNDGLMEDVATGSAAGTVGAYRLRHGLTRGGELFILNQGRFTGRPSILRVQDEGTPEAIETVKVGGDVVLLGRGVLEVLPMGVLEEHEAHSFLNGLLCDQVVVIHQQDEVSLKGRNIVEQRDQNRRERRRV